MQDDAKAEPRMPDAPADARQNNGILHAARATWDLQWSELSIRNALRCLPGMALPLAFGISIGNPGLGVLASSGALVAAFGSFQRLRGSCVPPMLLASIGISLSGFAGTLVGHSDLGFVLVAALWAYGTGLLMAFSTGAWWIGLQCAVFAIIASHFPQGLGPTLSRTATLAAGGLLQTLLILAIQWIEGASCAESPSSEPPVELRQLLLPAARTLRENVALHTTIGREAIRLAMAVGVAAAASRWFSLPNGYWMPMTVLLVMKADLYETITRGLGRIAGTLVGAGLATLLAATLRPGPVLLAGLVVLFSGFCFTLLRVNYAVFTIFVTAYVVFQLAQVGLPESAVVMARVLCTLLGGAIALIAHLIWHPTPEDALSETTREGEVRMNTAMRRRQ